MDESFFTVGLSVRVSVCTFMRCISVSLSWVRLYREEGRSAVGDVGEAGFFSGSAVLVTECWNTLGDSSSEDSSPWTAGPAFT